MKKKGLCLLLAALMASSVLAGCGKKEEADTKKDDTKTEASAEDSGEKVKLRLMSISTDENQTKILEDYIKKNLEAEMPNVEVEFEPGGGGEDMANKLKTYNASGDLPDVWYSTTDSAVAIINAGNMMDLTDAVEKDGFIDKYEMPLFNDTEATEIYTR